MMMFIAFAAFAEESEKDKSTGLTNADVKNFIKNYKTIIKDMESYNDFISTAGTAAALAALAENNAEKKVTAILNKNGISGSNALEKWMRLHYYTTIAAYDRTMEKTIAENPALAAYIASASVDPYAEPRKKLDTSDFNVIKTNIDEIMKAMDLGQS